MKMFFAIGIGAFVVVALLSALFVRRAAIAAAGGTIELCLRLTTMIPGRGWSSGLGRFSGEELRWYRIFSLSWRPRRVLARHSLFVESRRAPVGPETLVLPEDWVVVRCTSHQAPIEIAMAPSTLTGFLSWIEAAPPGAVSPRMAAR